MITAAPASLLARVSPVARAILTNRAGLIGACVVLVIAAIGVFGPLIAPYGPFEVVYKAAHKVLRLSPPTGQNWLGTTNQGMDVLSQLIWGTRIALLVGLLSALGSVLIGTAVGVAAGYFGGWIDGLLMLVTDIAFAIPFLPFALVVISIVKPSLSAIIVLIVAFQWRITARVIRAQVLSLRSRPFVRAARVAGAGHRHVVLRHILPNVLPFSFLYMAVGVQSGVMLEAALSFLGLGAPDAQSWGLMLNAAFKAGAMRAAWWWVLPPSVALSGFVISIFMVTRSLEEMLNPRLKAD